MGLLDSMFNSPESQQGLLAASAAMLEAGGPRRMPVGLGQAFGQAMTAGQGSYQDALKQKMLREKFEHDKLMQGMQLEQMKAHQEAAQRKAEEEARRRQVIEGMNPMQAGPVPQPQMDAFKMFQAGMLPATEYLKTMQPQPRKLMSVAPGQHVLDEADPTKPLFSAPERPPKQDIGALVIEGPDGKPMINPIALEAKRRIAEAGRSPSGGGSAAVADLGGESQAALTKQFGKAPPGYRWKPDGSQEFIPGGSADLKAQSKTVGEGTVDGVVADLRNKYRTLQDGGGITDTTAGAISNVGAGIASSGPGQAVGRMLGTKNQSERNSIAMARPLLLQAIMKATGMSAKQMDSNVELQLYLRTATDPTLDIQANMEALDRIENLYGSGAKANPPGAPPAPPKPNVVQSLPPANAANKGQRARDTVTNKILRSNGIKWVEE